MPKKILHIDDDDNFIQLLQEALTDAGHVILSAKDGKAGLRLARAERPDIVLLDLMMPGIHGFEVCTELRADPALVATKIIVISAKGYPFDITAAKAAGADQYLVKPFRLQQLLDLL